jgi:hypothetical protein
MKRPSAEESRLLRHYLLHALEENEQEQVELRLLAEKDFSRRLIMAQQDLIDDYVAGRLSDSEEDRFRQYYVTTPERLQRLKFGIALNRYVSERAPVRASDRPNRLFEFLRQRPYHALAAMAVLLVVGGTMLLTQFSLNPYEVDDKQSLKQEFVRINRGQDTRPLSVLKLSSPDTSVLTLRHNVVRGDAGDRDVGITSSVTQVRLLVEVPPNPYKTYVATLQTEAGEDLGSVSALESRSEEGAHFVVINIPAKLIPRGDYQLKLGGTREDGQADAVGTYSFRTTKG